ncbi:MAG: MTH938/NDUFAF3 family protein [bacterium]|jgi:hypothetical protein
MKPKIQKTGFGYVVVGEKRIEHDVVIRLNGSVEKRKKELSKDVYGTSHIISLEEAKHVFQDGAELLLVGAGQSGLAELSPEAAAYFQKKKCTVELLPTPRAIERWNEAKGAVIALLHITC